MLIPALRCFLLLLFTPEESAGGFVEEEEDRHLARLRAGNDRSSQGGVELEVEVGFELAAAAELRQRLGESCWVKCLWTHELCPQLEGALWIN